MDDRRVTLMLVALALALLAIAGVGWLLVGQAAAQIAVGALSILVALVVYADLVRPLRERSIARNPARRGEIEAMAPVVRWGLGTLLALNGVLQLLLGLDAVR